MILPVRNATLTKVAPKVSQDYEEPAGEADARWEGRADAHLIQETVTQVEGGRRDERIQTRLVFDANIPIAAGDVVHFDSIDGGQAREARDQRKDAPLGVISVTLADA